MATNGVMTGRRAVVTGGARGIGLAVAQRLLDEGVSVVVADVDQDALTAARDSIDGPHADRISVRRCDITDSTDVQTLSEQVRRQLGGLDILVNNAAILDWTAIEDLTASRLLDVMLVNFVGAIVCIQAFLPDLCRSPHARIVNISSINGMRGTSTSVAYNASKAALISSTQSLAAELSARGIVVNAVAPGFVDTRMSKLPDGSSEYDTEWFREVYIKHRRLPLGRPAAPADIAGPVTFLCSDDARYIHGQVLVVDGGVTATF
jgi:NAD(P)-dependent dehydrogenase (short-subunit alcohol dehydrogenase family)